MFCIIPQGDLEQRLGLAVTPMCNRHVTKVPSIQVGSSKGIAYMSISYKLSSSGKRGAYPVPITGNAVGTSN